VNIANPMGMRKKISVIRAGKDQIPISRVLNGLFPLCAARVCRFALRGYE